MADQSYPRKQWVVANRKFGDDINQKNHRISGCHPEHKLARTTPGIQLEFGKAVEIEIQDAGHEEILGWDKRLKFIDAPKAEAKPAEPEAEAAAPAPEVSPDDPTPAPKGKAKKG